MGYYDAGFDVVGVDINPQKHYPFEFIQDSWDSEAVWLLLTSWLTEGRAFAIHASPPCQRYSSMTKRWGREAEHPDLVAPVRKMLRSLDVPYVIENVVGAPLHNPITLCGSMFNLGVPGYQLRRHRNFESNFLIETPGVCDHREQPLPVYGHAGGRSKRDGLKFPGTDDWRTGMGINWMTGKELAESIPPAYTQYIGKALMGQFVEEVAA